MIKKLWRGLGNVCAVLYFVLVMLPWVCVFMPLYLLVDIGSIFDVIQIGFSTSSSIIMVGFFGMIISISLLVPALRQMYYKLPWLAPFVATIGCDYTIVAVALEILNFGYRMPVTWRHVLFIVLMLVWIVGARAFECWWFKRHPVRYVGEGATHGEDR